MSSDRIFSEKLRNQELDIHTTTTSQAPQANPESNPPQTTTSLKRKLEESPEHAEDNVVFKKSDNDATKELRPDFKNDHKVPTSFPSPAILINLKRLSTIVFPKQTTGYSEFCTNLVTSAELSTLEDKEMQEKIGIVYSGSLLVNGSPGHRFQIVDTEKYNFFIYHFTEWLAKFLILFRCFARSTEHQVIAKLDILAKKNPGSDVLYTNDMEIIYYLKALSQQQRQFFGIMDKGIEKTTGQSDYHRIYLRDANKFREALDCSMNPEAKNNYKHKIVTKDAIVDKFLNEFTLPKHQYRTSSASNMPHPRIDLIQPQENKAEIISNFLNNSSTSALGIFYVNANEKSFNSNYYTEEKNQNSVMSSDHSNPGNHCHELGNLNNHDDLNNADLDGLDLDDFCLDSTKDENVSSIKPQTP